MVAKTKVQNIQFLECKTVFFQFAKTQIARKTCLHLVNLSAKVNRCIMYVEECSIPNFFAHPQYLERSVQNICNKSRNLEQGVPNSVCGRAK